MVELVTLQTISYIAGSTSVVLGIIYYMFNLREQRRNQRINQAYNLTQKIETLEFNKIQAELLNFEWKDYEDYERKYGSDNNLDAYAKRIYVWRTFDSLGFMLKRNMVDAEILCDHGGGLPIILMWSKFEPVIKESRVIYSTGHYWMSGFEYLAGEMLKIHKRRDSKFMVQETFLKYVIKK